MSLKYYEQQWKLNVPPREAIPRRIRIQKRLTRARPFACKIMSFIKIKYT
jgi:hypothetical protein